MIRTSDIRMSVGTDMTSDPEDPHGWMFNCEVLNPAHGSHRVLKAWWVCRRCATTVRLSVDVTPIPHSGNEAYDGVCALSELAVRATVARSAVHPRCSEVRTIRDVMTA